MVRVEKLGTRAGIRNRTIRVFLWTLLVTTLAKGSALLPGYAIDDYALVLGDAPSTSMLAQGRFGQAILVHALHLLQLDPIHSRIVFVTFSIAVAALLGALLVRFWNHEKSGWLATAMACIVANHPYTVEIFTFRTAVGLVSAALAVLCLLLVPNQWSPRLLVAGTGLFALALSLYQLVLHFCLMIVAMGAAVSLTRYLVLGSSRGWPPRVVLLLSLRRFARHRNSALLACAVFGTALYLLLSLVFGVALRVSPGERTRLLPLEQLDDRAEAILAVLEYRLLEPGTLVARPAQAMLLVLLASAVGALLWRARPWRRPRPPLVAAAVLALLLTALAWTVGVLWLLEEFWPTPRVLAHVGIFWAGVLAIAFHGCPRRARALLAGLAGLIVLAFIGSNNRTLNDQLRVNARDAGKANRILARLESLPGFSAAEAVVVDGVDWAYPLHVRNIDHDMNISAFGATWAKLPLLREISGYDLGQPTAIQSEAAAAYCRAVSPWPSPESVTLRKGVAIVCLGYE